MSMILNYLRVSDGELRRLYADPGAIARTLYEEDAGRVVDLDKAWHGIHFLLTGEVWSGAEPLRNVVLGGRPIGDVDVGYGPARGLTSEEVRAVADALAEVDDAAFRSRFDAAALAANGVYPEIWDEGDDALDYLAEYYRVARGVFRDAAAAGDALIVFMN